MAKQETNNINFNVVFNMEPKEIVEYFEKKGLKTSYDWYEVYGEANAKAFTVAKMTELDLLKDTKNLLEKSLKEGQSYNRFKKEAESLFAKKGWTGKRVDVDSKGNAKIVELGTPRRIKKIYNCNMNSAYAVGRYKELCEEADVAPYWQYMCITDEKTRPEHLAMHGKVFRADDDFWTHFFPPNGWNCRCFVKNLTKGMLERKGLTVENSENKISSAKVKVGSEEKEIPTYSFIDGGVERILKPDAGWETNLGIKAWGLDIQAWNKVKDMPETIKYKFISEMATNPHNQKAYISWAKRIMKSDYSAATEKTLTWLTPHLYDKLKVNADIESPIVVMNKGQISHSFKNKNEKQMLSAKEYLNVYKIINNPDEIYFDYTNSKWTQIAFVRIIPNSEKCIKVCVRINQKSKSKDKNYLVSQITTIGKVNHYNLKEKKHYKKIE